jgi:hypothetical protein
MFEHFGGEELHNAKVGLSAIETTEDKTMNIDVAKIM